jgi:kinesin family protein 20
MIRNIEDFNEALNLGIMKKTHASTTLNSYSSRSHTIFKFIMRWSRGDCYEEASLSLVDLAGSERAYRAETSGKELQQACKINHSLYVLGKCMEIMKHNSIYSNKKIVPFRESKLTMLFQEYFQGDQNIIMVTNINPSKDDLNETLRVLSYSCTARDIKPIKSKLVSNYTYKPIK